MVYPGSGFELGTFCVVTVVTLPLLHHFPLVKYYQVICTRWLFPLWSEWHCRGCCQLFDFWDDVFNLKFRRIRSFCHQKTGRQNLSQKNSMIWEREQNGGISDCDKTVYGSDYYFWDGKDYYFDNIFGTSTCRVHRKLAVFDERNSDKFIVCVC